MNDLTWINTIRTLSVRPNRDRSVLSIGHAPAAKQQSESDCPALSKLSNSRRISWTNLNVLEADDMSS
jgi:hypothetical protein